MRIINCRYCGKLLEYESTRDLPHFPFCSEKCKLLDLGAWLEEDYRIEGDPAGEGDLPPDAWPEE
jgi:hypothetical protein